MAEMTGGCLCGRVRYVASGEPLFPHLCPAVTVTLDEPAAFVPTYESFCNSEQPWWHAGGERKRFPRGRT